MAPFIDFFVIGDGEDAVVELADTLRFMRGPPKREKLEAVAKLPGFYVPELYPFETLPDGHDRTRRRRCRRSPKRVVQSLDGAKFPTNYIVPYTQQVHDRVGPRVLRGCTHGCRFCQAGMVTRPVRERSLENIDELMERTLANTGYEEVSLASLSTCDYSRVRALVQRAVDRAHEENVAVSLPSLRLDSFSVELADMVAGVRRSGLTFAPEAASPRLRAVINKWIPDEGLLEMAGEAYRRGWQHVKTYFMIGLPTEQRRRHRGHRQSLRAHLAGRQRHQSESPGSTSGCQHWCQSHGPGANLDAPRLTRGFGFMSLPTCKVRTQRSTMASMSSSQLPSASR